MNNCRVRRPHFRAWTRPTSVDFGSTYHLLQVESQEGDRFRKSRQNLKHLPNSRCGAAGAAVAGMGHKYIHIGTPPRRLSSC